MSRAVTRRPVPLAPAAVAAWAAAAVAVLHPGFTGAVAAALWAAALGALAIAVRRRRFAVASVVLAMAALVTTHVATAQPAREAAAAFGVEGGRAIEVTAVVTSKVAAAGRGSLWFDADATRMTAGDRSVSIAVPVAVSVAPDAVEGGPLDLGAHVSVRGTAMVADAGDRAVLVLFASRGVEVTAAAAGMAGAASALRSHFVALATALPGDGGGLLPGLAVGDTSAVPPDLDAAMKTSSQDRLY